MESLENLAKGFSWNKKLEIRAVYDEDSRGIKSRKDLVTDALRRDQKVLRVRRIPSVEGSPDRKAGRSPSRAEDGSI